MNANRIDALTDALDLMKQAGIAPASFKPNEALTAEAAEAAAAGWTVVALRLRSLEVEREAEDAKVRAWLDHLHGGPTTTPITDWDRRTYRKHESFFTRDEGISVEALAEALGHELPEG